jgi:hypothetical protein
MKIMVIICIRIQATGVSLIIKCQYATKHVIVHIPNKHDPNCTRHIQTKILLLLLIANKTDKGPSQRYFFSMVLSARPWTSYTRMSGLEETTEGQNKAL